MPEPDTHPISSDFVSLSGTYFFLGRDLLMNLGGSDPFTIEGWVGYTRLDSAVPLFSKAGELVFGFTDQAQVFARRHFWESPLVSRRRLPAGAWHHLGITCDGDDWTLYINGVREGELAETAGDAPVNVGSFRRSAGLGCEVWNLRIWDRAQTGAQIRRAMRSAMVPQNGLIASFFPELPAATQLRLESDLAVSVA